MSKNNLFMLVGAPGVGKSTWIRNNMRNSFSYIASTDNMIEDAARELGLTYSEYFPKAPFRKFEKQMFDEVQESIKSEIDVVWDQTNMTVKSRASKIAMFPSSYRKIAIVFPVPMNWTEILNIRSVLEGKTIPQHILDNMVKTYVEPSKSEGFDEIRHVPHWR